MTIDTACSSSLVALDLACKGLWSKTSEMAIVAGANLICSPELNIALSNFGMLSPDRMCYSFDSRANGYARGEGFAALVLKPVSKAIQDGDTIRALVRATGVNQDGHTNGGLTQPSRELQAELIRDTYRKANLDMSITRYFEAHGTGTTTGDPTEARALGECFQHYRSSEEPLYVGAVKSNLGHLEGASGLAGVIKTILALEKGPIPPNANFKSLNPQIDAEFLKLQFPVSTIKWPNSVIRRASVNSFGFGGANAHCVLDDADSYVRNNRRPVKPEKQIFELPRRKSKSSSEEDPSYHSYQRVIVVSASDELGIQRLAKSYEAYLAKPGRHGQEDFVDDLAFTLNERRSLLPWKSYALISSKSLADLSNKLSKPVKSSVRSSVGYIFTGQGAQWYGMARELLHTRPFSQSISISQDILFSLDCQWSIMEELARDPDTTRLNDPEFSQTLTTIIQIALVQALEWLRVVPSVAVGHSSGEIAAAFCAGLISHHSAIKVAYYRGVLASNLSRSRDPSNGMASIGLAENDARSAIQSLQSKTGEEFDALDITISCINSTSNITVSGQQKNLDILVKNLQERGVFARKLVVSVGYHSQQMQQVATEYRQSLQTLDSGSKITRTQMMSSVKCRFISAEEACDGDYWVQNMVSPVQFLEATRLSILRSSKDKIVKKLDRSHTREVAVDFLLEVGPHSALQGPVRDIVNSVNRSNDLHYASVLTRKASATDSLQEAVGALFVRNVPVDLVKANRLVQGPKHSPRVLGHLPSYPFDHSTLHWEESRASREFRLRQHPPMPLLGTYLHDSVALEPTWKLFIRLAEIPWVKDHKVNGTILYPAAGMMVMAIEACKLLHKASPPVGYELREILFLSPIVIPDTGEPVEVQIRLRKELDADAKAHNFQIFAFNPSSGWDKVCSGLIEPDFAAVVSDIDNGLEWKHTVAKLVSRFAKAQNVLYPPDPSPDAL